jgi:streptogramin lyase
LGDEPHIFVDPQGSIWITEKGRHIYQVTPQGEAACAYTIADEQFHPFGRPHGDESRINPVYATADGQGRLWFWSDTLAGGSNLASLQGVLVFDGEKFEHHPHIEGVPDKKFSALAMDDTHHMWLAVEEDRLYRVDAESFTATPVSEPEPKVWRYVQKILRAGEETYVISGPMWRAVPEESGDGRSGVLWRLRGGQWTKLVNGLDSGIDYARHPARFLLLTPEGLWVGAYGNGPWFAPAQEARPVLIDWHYGFPFDGSAQLFRLSHGRLLIVALDRGSVAVRPLDLLASFQAVPEAYILNPLRPLIQDVRGHILGILASGDQVLSDWDGQTWRRFPLPESFNAEQFWAFAADSGGRVWLLPNAYGKSVAIFDPQRGTFEAFESYTSALEAQLPQPEGFHLGAHEFTVPSFTRDGRICYRDPWYRVWYFDGRKWSNWPRQRIDGNASFVLDGPPFFDRAGNIAVNIEGRTWEFNDEHGWHTTNYEPGLSIDQESQQPPFVPMPPGCSVGNPESIAQDRLGTYWLTSPGQLYRAIPGLCVSQFAAGEHQPFIDSREVREALIDEKGTAFLRTHFASGVEEYVVLKPQGATPQTGARIKTNAAGRIELAFSTTAKGNPWFTWRVDGAAWTAPNHARQAALDWLPQGKHTLEAASIDERLQIDPTPAKLAVDVHVDPQEQTSRLIELLAAPDFATREAAVAGLLRQPPALALPALKAARAQANPDRRWWIDAALQQIQDR